MGAGREGRTLVLPRFSRKRPRWASFDRRTTSPYVFLAPRNISVLLCEVAIERIEARLLFVIE
jgi:hypothetical protein